MFRGRVRRVHFVGVGGIGMSGLAEILRTLEFDVSGSDLRQGENTRHLERLGVRIDVGHRAENVRGADVVVISSAIARDNPEVLEALACGTPVIQRAEMLAELMRVKYGVAIAGSHGKTTTTSLVATVLRVAGYDPTVVVGGRMAAFGSNARLGEGDLLVAEADESDGSFLRLTPTIAAITNIDPEHLDYYGSHDNLKQAFVQFVEKVPFYGLSPQADYSARAVSFQGTSSHFIAYRRSDCLGQVSVRMPGQHNVLNCLAAIAVADELEVPLDVIKQALATFHGVARRFTVTAEVAGVTLIDDYGHHPAEIRATLDAARGAYSERVLVAFQPHRYTRTQLLFEEFTRSFNEADLLLVTDIYPAGERPIEGVSAERLVHAIAEHGHHNVRYARDRSEIVAELVTQAQRGDVVIALGAGDINKILPEVRAGLACRAPGEGVS